VFVAAKYSMTAMSVNHRSALRTFTTWCLLGPGLVGLCGCANFWDEVTSRDFHFKNLFVHKEQMVVLRESTDGDERAKAMLKLHEPKQRGGTDQDQDWVVDLLVKTAAQDRQPLCRLAAVEKLGEFKDPRVVKGLHDAFFQANDFGPDLALRIQCQALASLGKTGNAAAVPILIEQLREPPAERSDLAQQRSDRCMAAARALAGFKDPQATEALARVLQNSKEDIALRERAHESLQVATGQHLPAEYQAWEDYLHPKDGKPPEDDKAIKLAGFRLY
jgi:HEAT repeats/PBS lyase HEAT-like repeat